MSIYFSTNVPELRAMASYKTAESQIAKSSTRLATGQRVNSGADDAVGFQIREGLRADFKTNEALQSGILTAENKLSIAQSGINEALKVLRGDPNDDSDNGLIGIMAAAEDLTAEPVATAITDAKVLYDTALGAMYNGEKVFGSASTDVKVGTDTASKITYEIKAATAWSAADVDAVKTMIDGLTEQSAALGQKQNAFANAKNNITALTTSLREAEGKISSVDTAMEGSNLARAELLAQNSMNVMQYSRSFASFVATSAFG